MRTNYQFEEENIKVLQNFFNLFNLRDKVTKMPSTTFVKLIGFDSTFHLPAFLRSYGQIAKILFLYPTLSLLQRKRTPKSVNIVFF